ncbi:hypothetical protein GP486_005825 [Trichoglossum hirsutum]|uniref:VWFA domain-containing protein n=1 Tax=Trichoglossum hirsutum TaxID=265104 RepID=A0A9P8L8H9_9PEZI|nr:hypothetical protein GP486_005825 [Trichoglossum hirsutum]
MATRYIVFLVSLLAVNPPVVSGFFPTQWKEDFAGNGGISHEDMTRVAFEDRAYLYFPSITTISSKMRAACMEIQKANIDVDDDQKTAHKHCDGESFGPAKARIQQLKKDAIGALLSVPPDVAKARKNVGEALHTIQDFYAHSNWVELGNRDLNADLIRDGAMELYTAAPDQRTCNSCQTLPKPATWDSDWPIPCIGINCIENTKGFSKLTSGYYHGEDVAIPGDFKCRHGGLSDDSWAGINKDSLNCWWSPHSHLHATAADLAERATMQFFDDIKADTSGAPQALRLLFGVPTLAFAIDTTGSMGDVIDAVRTQAISIAKGLAGTDNEPGLYVISPFNDPETGPVTVTTDFTTFEHTINSLGAEGGGDCPEMAVTGMINAVDAMDVDSGLLLFTDAVAKDSGLLLTLLAKAQEKRITISVFMYASDCEDSKLRKLKRSSITKRSEDVYGQLCAGTGGLLRTGPRTEVANVTSFIENVIKTNLGTILRVEDSLSSTGTNNTKSFDVPVDSYTSNVMFSLLGSGMKLSITTPDGKPLSSSAPGLTQTILIDSTYISLPPPTPGIYKATISGNGTFTFLGAGVSTLQLSSFNFASVRGRPGHTGWYPMAGTPPFDKDVGAIAEMAGGFKTANFSFRAPSFAAVAGATTSNMTAGSGQPGFPRNSSFFAPAVRVPRQNLLLYVMGEDDKGMPYQRALQAVVVTANGTVPRVNTTATYPNSTTTYRGGTATAVPTGPLYPTNSTVATGKPSTVPTAGAVRLEVSSAAIGLVTMLGMFVLGFLL